MPFTPEQLVLLRTAALALDFDSPLESVVDFAIRVLGLSPAQQVALFANDDAADALAVTNDLTTEIERLLTFEGIFPPYGILITADFDDRIGGFGSILRSLGAETKTVARLRSHRSIREALRVIHRGHDLEAIAAAILEGAGSRARATKGSGDQGVDMLGWSELLPTFPLFASLVDRGNQPALANWEKVFFVASSKANIRNAASPTLLNPASIRELVGSWLIQRTSIGRWSDVGILPLSALQVILVTTYRLSSAARAECRRLGAQIWSLAELTYLIARHAPDEIFEPNGEGIFDPDAFVTWWTEKAVDRVSDTAIGNLMAAL